MTTIRIEREEGTIPNALVFLLALALVGVIFAIGDRPARAASAFVVDSTQDAPDADITDNKCAVVRLVPPGTPQPPDICTLRAAIEQANATAGADAINFDILDNLAGAGVKTIAPVAALPAITEQVTVNGYSQPGASPNTKAVGNDAVLLIELSGANIASGANGLRITGGTGSVVKGLVINEFSQDGVLLGSSGTTGNRIEGNYIGTDATGTHDVGNGGYGVELLQSDDNTIGGTSAGARNLISGNEAEGIIIESSSNTVQGNYIGTKKDGTSGLGNSGHGLYIFSPNNVVGGLMLSEGNRISFNGDDGVEVSSSVPITGNAILANSIYANNGLGIDLFPGGVTPNDPKDLDIGANNLQNYPVITRASTPTRGKTAIKGKLDSTPDTIFDVQFFANPKGTDEGLALVGRQDVSTGTDGKASFAFKLTKKVPRGQAITATATDSNGGNTSEFSAPRKVVRQR
jgi:CSLREA domain-containing protein